MWFTCYDIGFFQNFQGKPRNFSGVFTKGISLDNPLVFFLEQTTDRQIGVLIWVLRYPPACLLHWPRTFSWTSPKQMLLQITSIIYTFILFSNNFLVCNLKVFSFYKIWVTYAIFDILKEADWMLFQASANNFCYVPTILLYRLWKCKYWCIQKGLHNIM